MTSILLASSLLVLVLLVTYLAHSLKESSTRQWMEYRSGSMDQMARMIDEELIQTQNRLKVVAHLEAFQAPLDTSLINRSLNGIARGVDPKRRKALDWLMAEADHGFNVIFVLLPNGDHYISHPYSVQKNLKTYNLAHRPYFMEAQKTLEPVLSNTFVGADGTPAVAIDIPILDKQRKIISHLGGVFHLNQMVQIIERVDFVEPYENVFLLDGKGALIAQRGATQIDVSGLAKMILEKDAAHHSDSGSNTGVHTFYIDNVEQVMMVSHLSCNWTLAVVSPQKSITDKFTPDIQRTATLAGILFFVVSLVSLIFANRIGLGWQADERKRKISHDHTEAALSAREALFKAITNQSSEGITVADTKGNYIFVNQAFCNMIGYTEKELLQMTVFDVKSESQDTTSFSQSKSSMEGLPITVFLKRKDGTEFHSEVVGKMIVVGGEKQVLGIIRDITDRLIDQEERLLLERQMQHAQKLESLGILAGGIAHDFNNLLMAILGNTDLAQMNISPMSPAQENLLEIEKATRRAADLAHQMLAYSGKGHFVIQPIGLGDLVYEMGHLLDVSISKKVAMQYNLADNLPTFNGDATQIRQVVLNLITNASEAIGDQTGTITLSSGTMQMDRFFLENKQHSIHGGFDSYPTEGTFVSLTVCDSGCGMDKETRDKIFDPFFTTKFTGRGLGMSSVQGIVRGHKGIILVESQKGSGTTFTVLFPANTSTEPLKTANKQAIVTPPISPVNFSGTVLLVDDEISVRTVGSKILGLMGFKVLTAEDGVVALDIFREISPEISCVLLDLTMPNMDGKETFHAMKQVRPDVTIILCSGYNELEATKDFEDHGLAGFIQKPFKMSTLQAKFSEVFSQKP